jgi:hypothetical protein
MADAGEPIEQSSQASASGELWRALLLGTDPI